MILINITQGLVYNLQHCLSVIVPGSVNDMFSIGSADEGVYVPKMLTCVLEYIFSWRLRLLVKLYAGLESFAVAPLI